MKIWLFFFRKNLVWGNVIFLGYFLLFDRVWLKSSQATVNIGSLNTQDMFRILKRSGHDFSGKRLCDGYCMDIVWCLCVEINIQQMVAWFCEKSFFKNCYIILSERKGPWMLKTDSLIF